MWNHKEIGSLAITDGRNRGDITIEDSLRERSVSYIAEFLLPHSLPYLSVQFSYNPILCRINSCS